MTFNKRLLSASAAFICLLCFCVEGLLFAENKSEKTEWPNFVPGSEVRVEVDNKDIGGNHFLVYVPADYTDEREWPVIFVYHGMNGQPMTWPFKQITRGKGSIVIGMGYLLRGRNKFTPSQYRDYYNRERKSVLEVKRYVSKYLRIDEKRLFVAGYSKGGWHTSAMLESGAKIWAGAVIFAAGRGRNMSIITSAANKKALQDKPIYIGAGEKEANLASAKKAATYYERLGAEVTFEEYKGAGHVFDPVKSKILYNWLIANSATDYIESDEVDEDKSAEPTE